MRMSRDWYPAQADTFLVRPIAELLDRYLTDGMVIVDPFSRNSGRGTVRNDIDPATSAQYHMEALDFCQLMSAERGSHWADAVLFDPPYSPEQVSRTYKNIGRTVTARDTQNGRLYAVVRDALVGLLAPGGLAFSFGWNSSGFCRKRGFFIEEILLVCHGGAHNDTICVVERKVG